MLAFLGANVRGVLFSIALLYLSLFVFEDVPMQLALIGTFIWRIRMLPTCTR